MNMERETPGLHKQMKELLRNETNWENKETFFLEKKKKVFNLKPEVEKKKKRKETWGRLSRGAERIRDINV